MFSFNVYPKSLGHHVLAQEPLHTLKKYNIMMKDSRAYPGLSMRYKSILMKSLLKEWHVKKEQIIELIAKDHFSVFVPAYLLFQTDKQNSIAYLAIEPKEGWPILKNGTDTSAGPYQIIWTHPQYSHISDEYWAWSITHIAIHQNYPVGAIISRPKTKELSIQQGYDVFISHCASCHNINHIGKASIGPDLGIEHSPLKSYPTRGLLKAFIREPTKFRPGRMSGSSLAGMNEKELDHLIDYFYYLQK
jgi:hypothetical protein